MFLKSRLELDQLELDSLLLTVAFLCISLYNSSELELQTQIPYVAALLYPQQSFLRDGISLPWKICMLLHSAPPAVCATSVGLLRTHRVIQNHHLLDQREVNSRFTNPEHELAKNKDLIALQPAVSYLSCCFCEATKSLGCNSNTFSKDQKIPSFCILGNACH